METRMASPYSDTNSVLSCLNNIALDTDDVFLQDLLHDIKPSSPSYRCGSCREAGACATSRCQECNELLCDNCVRAHLRVRLTKDHFIIRLENESPNQLSTPNQLSPFSRRTSPSGSAYCEFHNSEIIKLYCDNCFVPICGDCSTRDHRGHTISFLQDAMDGSRTANLKLLTDSRIGAQAVKDSLEITQKMLDAVNTRAHAITRDVQNFAAKLHLAIKERENELLTKVEKIRHAKGMVLVQQIEGLRHAFARFIFTSEQLTETLEVGSPMDQLHAKAQAFKDLRFLSAVKVSLQPQEDDCITFTPPDMALVRAVSNFGDLVSSGYAAHPNMALGEGLMHAVRGRANSSSLKSYSRSSSCDDLISNGRDVPCLPGIENNVAVGEIGDKREANKIVPYRQKYESQIVLPKGRRITGIKFPPICMYFARNYMHPGPALLTFGLEGDGDGQLCRPWGVCCSKEGNIIVADRSNNRIQVFSGNGNFLLKFGKHGNEPGEFDRPAGVAVNPLGHIIVADKDNHRIQVFTKDGHLLFAFGEKGCKNGQFNYPWDVDVNADGLIVVSDTRNHRIQLFSRDGMFLNKYGFETSTGMWKHFDSPRGVCFGPKGIVIVTDFNNHRLVVIEQNFMQARFLGNEGSNMKQFLRPQGVAVDGDGHVVVADSRNNRIQVFEPNGSFLCQFGGSGKEPGLLDRPSGISLMPDGRIVVVDFGNNRVQVF